MTQRNRSSSDRATWKLQAVAVLFVGVGLWWAVLGVADPLGFYESWTSNVFLGTTTLPPEVRAMWRFAVALLGALTAAFFVLFYWVVREALATGAPWAYRALWTSLLVWFVPDSLYSLRAGALFNVLAINIPCLLLVGGCLIAWERDSRPTA